MADILSLRKKSEIIEVEGAKILLTSLTVADALEKRRYAERAHKLALAYTREQAENIATTLERMTAKEMRDYVASVDGQTLENDKDLLNVENADVLSKEQIEEKRTDETAKLKRKIRDDLDSVSDEEIKLKAQTYLLRSVYIYRFLLEMELPSLVLICKDPETGKRIFSLDPKDPGYIGNLDESIVKELLDRTASFREGVDASGIRSLAEDPNFLLLTPYLRIMA